MTNGMTGTLTLGGLYEPVTFTIDTSLLPTSSTETVTFSFPVVATESAATTTIATGSTSGWVYDPTSAEYEWNPGMAQLLGGNEYRWVTTLGRFLPKALFASDPCVAGAACPT